VTFENEERRMTIEEIDGSLPNGFHDADITGIQIDYVRREAIFTLEVDVSSLETGTRERSYRPAELKLSGLLYLIIEPPDRPFGEEEFARGSKPWITADSSDFGLLESVPVLPEPLPPGGFRHWFFNSRHNCFIYVAAMDAGFEWID
jgi:hypothetical protein